MKCIKFQCIMNGVLRKAIPKEKVKGYTHKIIRGKTNNGCDVHIYKRGNLEYVFDDLPILPTLQKYDYSIESYVDITYEEFYKFVDIVVIGEMKGE